MTADRLTQLENNLNNVRQKNIPVLRDTIEPTRRKIQQLHEILESQRASEVGTFARIGELNGLGARIESVPRTGRLQTR